MQEGRLEKIKAWAEEPLRRTFPLDAMEFADTSRRVTLELVAEVKRLNGRLQAVCDVLSNADATDGVIRDGAVMEAVWGFRQATIEELREKLGPTIDEAILWKWIWEFKAVVWPDGSLVIEDLTGLMREMMCLRD